MKKIIYLILLSIMIMSVSAITPIYVDNEGNDSNNGSTWALAKKTIQAGIDAVDSAGNVYIRNGTYTITGDININKNITITGNVNNPENVTIQYISPTNIPVFDMRISGITVEGIKTISGKSGFYFDQSATECKISHCIIENTMESGIYIYNGNTHTIEHTTIINPGQNGNIGYSNGVYTRADTTLIDNCTITSDKVQHMKWGVNFEAGINHQITKTNINSSWQGAIRVASGVKPVTIINNNINDATEGYVYEGAISLSGYNDGSIISGNIINNIINSSAIVVYPAWDITITNNRIGVDGTTTDIKLEGIRVEGCGGSGSNRVEIINNTIRNTGYSGILLVNSDNVYVYDNNIDNCNNYGVDGTGDWDYASIHVDENSDNVIIDNNNISDGISGVQIWGNSCIITNNKIYDMGSSYANTKVTSDGTYYNTGIIIGSNWLTNNFKPTGTIITDNKIYNNHWGMYVRDYENLSPSDSAVLNVIAEYNYWGSSVPISVISDNIDYYPCYNDETLTIIYTEGIFNVTKNTILDSNINDTNLNMTINNNITVDLNNAIIGEIKIDGYGITVKKGIVGKTVITGNNNLMQNIKINKPITDTGNSNTYTNVTPTYITYSSFTGGLTTPLNNLILNVDIENLNITLENDYGIIKWEGINITTNGDMDSLVVVTQNYISVDTISNSGLNKDAIITLKNVNPTVNEKTKFKILRNGKICTDEYCLGYIYNAITKKFKLSVSGFSSYEVTYEDILMGNLITGLPIMGTDMGEFMTNIVPGIGVFIIIITVFVGIGAIVYSIVGGIKGKIK